MRKFKINSAASVSPSPFENEVDEQFLQDLSSVITMEDGSSIDLSKAVLLYNPETKQIQISDAESYPNGFQQVATLTPTSTESEADTDEPFEELTEEGTEETQKDEESTPRTATNPEEGEENSEDERLGETTGREDSGDFFQ